jgi:pyruvate,water dikinase
MIYRLGDLPSSERAHAGGKAGTLDQLIRAGYRVPAGLVILPQAFSDGALRPEAWAEVSASAAALRRRADDAFAVRSSAMSEDSSAASFAGEFETILNVQGGGDLQQAIQAIYESSRSARAASYAQALGLDGDRHMAVIVQRMVPAELSGVLFTADPLTGSREQMHGTFVSGLGERLVSGRVSGEVFTLERPSGRYQGPVMLKGFAKALFKQGEQLADELGSPQDIEWATAGGRLYILQSRPITSLQAYDQATGVHNDSKRGVYLWSNANFGEALPGVMTPLTWSLIQIYAEETFGNPLPGHDPMMGNLAGRFYINLSLFASLMHTLGFSRERMNYESQEFFGNLPEDVEVPLLPFSRWQILRRFLPFALRAAIRRLRNLRRLQAFTIQVPVRTAALADSIGSAATPSSLARIWESNIEPYVRQACQMLQAGTSGYENRYRPLSRELMEQVGEEEANLLLSGVSAEGNPLASLGPLLGLEQVARGELDKAAYLARYGHRGDQEMELSWPRPYEDPGWLDVQLANLADSDVSGLIDRQARLREQAWVRYVERFPAQAAGTRRKLEAAAVTARDREAIRSEVTRLVGLGRQFALKAGQLTGLGEGVFFLSLEELLAALNGAEDAGAPIPVRRSAHERLSALPPYPTLIVGRFDPFSWLADPNRRGDLFDARSGTPALADWEGNEFLRGLPGSAGVVEGRVRRLERIDQGHLLAPGEVLVTATTNIGWTPLFPRAAAVVTDVGAPLSHAAIVARELGIPAVVGAGDATTRLQTGDWVQVDGARGLVQLLDGPAAARGSEAPPGTAQQD